MKKIDLLFSIVLIFIIGCKQIVKRFYPDGKIRIEYQTKNGKIDGEKKEFYQTGELESIAKYSMGSINDSTSYYQTGQINGTMHFRNNKIDGIAKEYYLNGHLFTIGTYKSGKLNGAYKMYNKKSRIFQYGYYLDDSLLYIKKYDTITGAITDIGFSPQIKVEKNIINVNEYYNAKINLYCTPATWKIILYGAFIKDHETKLPSLPAIDTLRNTELNIRWKTDSPGTYIFDGVIRMTKPYSDSVMAFPISMCVKVKK